MPPYTGANLTYVNAFQKAVRDVVLDLPTATQPQSAVYSSACFKHCTSTLAWGSFWGVKVDNMSLKTFLADWYFGQDFTNANYSDATYAAAGTAALPAGISNQRIEACNGFGCAQCHRKVVPPAPPLPPAYATSLIPGQLPERDVAAVAPTRKRKHVTGKHAAAAAHGAKKAAGTVTGRIVMLAGSLVAIAGCALAHITRRGGIAGATRARAPGSTGTLELQFVGDEKPLLRPSAPPGAKAAPAWVKPASPSVATAAPPAAAKTAPPGAVKTAKALHDA